MGILGSARRGLDAALEWPIVRPIAATAYEYRFARNRDKNLFRGVFDTFAAAQASAPPTRPVGYDHPGPAAMYRNRVTEVFACDYPAMFWLQKLLAEGARSVYDLGGHIGVSYYAYGAYLDYPKDLSWRVHDVPAVMAAGREWAAEHDARKALSFSDSLADAAGTDILFASGSLQYLDYTLAQALKQLAQPPRNLLINLLPVHPTQSFFTLQSIGTAFCPYRIHSQAQFRDELAAIGYRVRDRWDNPEKTCLIRLAKAHSLDGYHGFLLSRDS